ncbi:hypothetical protein J3E68DRAFT_420281 [Trichoderma sp. SZMC 28012]
MQGTMQSAPKGPPRMDWISTNLQVTRFDMGWGLERNLPSASLTFAPLSRIHSHHRPHSHSHLPLASYIRTYKQTYA